MNEQTKRRVLFLQQGVYENLGVMMLSACLKQDGHDVHLLVQSFEKRFFERILDYSPDIVCFTVLTGMHRWVRDLAIRIKEKMPSVWVVCGGAHPTFFPSFADEQCVDAICVGEGEATIREICAAYPDHGALKGLANVHATGTVDVSEGVRPFVENLDELPFPDRSIYYKYPFLRDASRKTFLAIRGCPYNCSFCFNHQMMRLYKGKGTYIRKRSPLNIVQEMIDVRDRYGLQSVFFQDDCLILDREWLRELLERVKTDVGLPFTCLIRANLVDEELVRLLKKCGCAGTQFGIESGNEKIRNAVLRKNLSDEQILNCGRLLKKYGIPFKTYNILGLPSEEIEDMYETARINIAIKTDFPWASILMPYPGTDIAEMLAKEGRFPESCDLDSISSTFFDMKPSNEREKVTLNFQRLFILAVKFPFLFGLIRRAVHLPPNFVFDYIFYLSEFYVYKQSEQLGWWDSLKAGYYFKKNNF